MNAPLGQMLRYNRWANVTLFEACRPLTAEQLAVRGAGTSGTVAELLVHIAGGEQTFVLRTSGRQHEGELNRDSAWPGIGPLIAIVRETGDHLVSIAGNLEDERSIDLPFVGKRYRYPVSFFLAHAVSHAAEHRTEVKVALGAIGVATPDLDGWAFAAAMGYGDEA